MVCKLYRTVLLTVSALAVLACRDVAPTQSTELIAQKAVVVCPTGWIGEICNGGIVICEEGTEALGESCVPADTPGIEFDPCYPFGCTGGGGGGGGNPTTPACNDERDAIIAEYQQYGMQDIPTCSVFTQNGSNAFYSFTDLAVNTDHAWIILRPALTVGATAGYGLEKWVALLGFRNSLNSVYRCPQRNFSAGGVGLSRHMFGDAVDMRNPGSAHSTWLVLENAAKMAKAGYTEPTSLPCKTNCMHADWRNYK